MITNEEYIQEYVQTRDLSKNTYYSLKSVLNHYSDYQECSLNELLEEADLEEEQGIRWKRRKLKTRLTNYSNHCKKEMSINSAKSYLHIVKSFYNHHELEIGTLPAINKRNAQVNNPITYNDLPDKDIIRTAVEISTPLFRCLILFLSSTGMAKVDARKLTINDFLIATYEYHKSTDIATAVNKMLEYEDVIIPTWKHRRSKTNKYFVTFNTPECTTEILNYLVLRLSKSDLKLDDLLFPVNEHYFTKKFGELNDMMGLGKVGSYRRFRGHMLRKFHSSNLKKAGMDKYEINVLQGKSNGAVDDVYFFEDENKLREDYIKYMDSLMVFTKVKEINQYSFEYLELEKQNTKLKEELGKVDELKKEVAEIRKWFID